MKSAPRILLSAILSIICLVAVTYSSCTKGKITDPTSSTTSCANIVCQNGGTCNNGFCLCPLGFTGTYCEEKPGRITYRNTTFTEIVITLNGERKIIPVGGEITYGGMEGNPATGSATTRGTAGQTITWAINRLFPIHSSVQLDLSVPADYFYLRVTNQSTEIVTTLHVNFGIPAESVDNVNIPGDMSVYGIGYYNVFPDTKIRAESISRHWDYNITLPATVNQFYDVVVN